MIDIMKKLKKIFKPKRAYTYENSVEIAKSIINMYENLVIKTEILNEMLELYKRLPDDIEVDSRILSVHNSIVSSVSKDIILTGCKLIDYDNRSSSLKSLKLALDNKSVRDNVKLNYTQSKELFDERYEELKKQLKTYNKLNKKMNKFSFLRNKRLAHFNFEVKAEDINLTYKESLEVIRLLKPVLESIELIFSKDGDRVTQWSNKKFNLELFEVDKNSSSEYGEWVAKFMEGYDKIFLERS